MKTYVARPSEINRKWLLIDAENLVLGRLSVILANYVRGKHKPCFTPSTDCGDNVVVINAEKVLLTGKKSDGKIHYWHTGYPGGIKSETYGEILKGKKPQKAIQLAVKRMVPKGPLGKEQLKKLYIYNGEEHPHTAQKPELVDISVMNKKNKRDDK
jgi:large subunit ribosomal protein L13